MNWLDVVLLLVLVVSVATSFSKGLTREVIGMITLVTALLLAIWFYGLAGGWLLPYVSSRTIANVCGFLLVFFGVNVLGSLVGYMVSRALKVTGLSFFDRVLGAGFGVARAVILSIVLVMTIMAFAPGERAPSSVVHSRFAPYVVDAAHVVSGLAPHELKSGFRKSYAQVKSAWQNALKQATPSRSKKAQDEREI